MIPRNPPMRQFFSGFSIVLYSMLPIILFAGTVDSVSKETE